jgi:hypothetical protein
VFIQHLKTGDEISILAPAHSGFFDQILDIPVASIKDLSIITDEFSQNGARVGLNLESTDYAIFLDSKRIELDDVYLVFQPRHAKEFKKKLIERCPGLKLVEADKKALLAPNSSGTQRNSESVVTDEIVVSTAKGIQRSQRSTQSPLREPRARRNSIAETQVEQENTQRDIGDEDELQNSMDAGVSNTQDPEDNNSAAQTAMELPKVTPTSATSETKSNMPPKAAKPPVVKPRAKVPILQRVLRQQPSQASTQQPTAAPTARTSGQQKQTESASTMQPDPAPQVTKSSQKRSEPAGTLRRPTATQRKKVPANSQPNMPPPKSKANTKTGSTGSSQVADDIEDPEVLDETKQRGSRNGLGTASTQNAPSSKYAPGQGTDENKSQSYADVNAKRTSQPSHTSKDRKVQDFSADELTDVDGIDASTSKLTGKETQARKKILAPAAPNTQTHKLSTVAGTTSQKRKRYSLNPPVKTSSVAGDPYEITVDDDDDEEEAAQKIKGKKSAKARKSAGASGKTTSKTASKIDAKKRKSAPAALGRPAGTRSSQRAAAAKANEQIRGADKSDIEDAEIDDQPAPPRSQVAQKNKAKATGLPAKPKVAPKTGSDNKVVATNEQDQEMSQLPDADESVASPHQRDTNGLLNDDNLYDSMPKKPSKKPAPHKLQDPTVQDNQGPAKVSKAANRDKRDSAIDLASKLGGILEDVSYCEAEAELQGSSVRKEFKESVEPSKRKPANADAQEVVTVAKSTKPVGNASAPEAKSNTPAAEVVEVFDSSSSEDEEGGQVDPSPPAPKQRSTPPAKSNASEDNIFKKPEIPTRAKETPNRQQVREQTTGETKSTILGQDLATSKLVNKIILEEARDTPMETASDCPDTGENRKKRKAEINATMPSKKQRVDESGSGAKESSPAPYLPSSPPVREPSSAPVKMTPKPKQPKKSRNLAEKTTSPRRSPRLVDRARRAAEALQQATSERTSTIKDPDRKPHLVSFGINGALNQGRSSAIKVGRDHKSTKDVPEEVAEPIRDEVAEKKRKREKLDVVDAESPPSKRKSVSPMAVGVADDDEEEHENRNLPLLEDSPPAETSKPSKAKSKHTRRSAKPSSQTSRVDKNGSPLAFSQEDHFRRLQQRLSEDRNDIAAHATAPIIIVKSPVGVRQRRLSEVFGPKVVLEKKSRARKSSPEETAARYIAHEKTADDVYQQVATKQVVALEKKLQDPFTDKDRKSSDFTERLMSGSSSEKYGPYKANKDGKEKRKAQVIEPAIPLQPRGASKANRRSEPARRTQPVDVRERSRAEVENQQLSDDSPSEMTMGSSYESQASEQDQMSLSNGQAAMWNAAIRPHYTNLHAAIHKIADVSTISLRQDKANDFVRK